MKQNIHLCLPTLKPTLSVRLIIGLKPLFKHDLHCLCDSIISLNLHRDMEYCTLFVSWIGVHTVLIWSAADQQVILGDENTAGNENLMCLYWY